MLRRCDAGKMSFYISFHFLCSFPVAFPWLPGQPLPFPLSRSFPLWLPSPCLALSTQICRRPVAGRDAITSAIFLRLHRYHNIQSSGKRLLFAPSLCLPCSAFSLPRQPAAGQTVEPHQISPPSATTPTQSTPPTVDPRHRPTHPLLCSLSLSLCGSPVRAVGQLEPGALCRRGHCRHPPPVTCNLRRHQPPSGTTTTSTLLA